MPQLGGWLLPSHRVSPGICNGRSGTWMEFLRVLRFSVYIPFPPAAPHPVLNPTYFSMLQ
jgi:hypothetical protein